MIRLQRLDGSEMVLNADLIECVEERPDTIITLTTGKKLVVRDRAETIVERVVEYRRRIYGALPEMTRYRAEES